MFDGDTEVSRHGAIDDGIESGIEMAEEEHVWKDFGVGGEFCVQQEDDDVVW